MSTYAVILAGGRGERFWPMSRRNLPKQFLHLFGRDSLIKMTSSRIRPICPLNRQRFVIDSSLSKVLCQQLQLVPENLILEPFGRNTAPAIALAAAYIRREDPNAFMVVLPADHLIRDQASFLKSIRTALLVASQRLLVTIGILPNRADTNYGYIEVGKRLQDCTGHAGHPSRRSRSPCAVQTSESFSVRSFREKPTRALAERYVESGRFWWNSGMFVWRVDTFLQAVGEFMPGFRAELEVFAQKIGTSAETRALRRLYRNANARSVDYAIMEKAGNVAVVRAEFDWDDVGSWTALGRHFPEREPGTVAIGDFASVASSGCLSVTDQGIVALIGCHDLIVIRHGDAVLVVPHKELGRIKELLAALAGNRRLRRYL